jgi:2-oxoglutarate ferredoxin oxidoreductase subunit alpha
LTPIPIKHPEPTANGNGAAFHPYARNEFLARPWAIPGTPGLMHRIGGLEKQDVTGNVSYDPENHQKMVHIRARKVAGIADDIPLQTVQGPDSGRLLVLSWGGTYGACATAVKQVQRHQGQVAHAHLRYLNPLPRNLGDLLKRYDTVLIPELNLGQLRMLIRAEFLVETVGMNKVKGKPFSVVEVVDRIEQILDR